MAEGTTESGGRAGGQLHDSPGHLVRRLHQNMTAAFAQAMGGVDINNVQFAALKAIEALGPTTQRSIADYIAMEPSNMHGLLHRLQQRGLISIRPDPGDRRRSEIRLARPGRALLARLAPRERQVGPAFLAPLDAHEQAEFLRLLRKLVLAAD